MRGTLPLIILLVASSATAQMPRKPACELLRVADVEAALGVSPLRAIDPASRLQSSLKTGASCSFEKAPNQQVFSIIVEYADAPDADAVTTWLKVIETRTYDKARPASGLGDAAYYTELQGNPAAPKTLTVFVAGTMLLQLRPGTSDQQPRRGSIARRRALAKGFRTFARR